VKLYETLNAEDVDTGIIYEILPEASEILDTYSKDPYELKVLITSIMNRTLNYNYDNTAFSEAANLIIKRIKLFQLLNQL
jgi:hypothetical protein